MTLESAARMHRDLPYLVIYIEMCSATDYKVKSIGGMCILIQMWAWERCTSLTPKMTPPLIENKPLGHRLVEKKLEFISKYLIM